MGGTFAVPTSLFTFLSSNFVISSRAPSRSKYKTCGCSRAQIKTHMQSWLKCATTTRRWDSLSIITVSHTMTLSPISANWLYSTMQASMITKNKKLTQLLKLKIACFKMIWDKKTAPYVLRISSARSFIALKSNWRDLMREPSRNNGIALTKISMWRFYVAILSTGSAWKAGGKMGLSK